MMVIQQIPTFQKGTTTQLLIKMRNQRAKVNQKKMNDPNHDDKFLQQIMQCFATCDNFLISNLQDLKSKLLKDQHTNIKAACKFQSLICLQCQNLRLLADFLISILSKGFKLAAT
ncbi:unnamed protein product [Paramecium sonneborni]|uniref:Uncharacterized protein n=1 Tax=Paramecium sonneborni TaxID=65129 RepID=A0A8S1LG96_9CILI|nr:unnamed protein product [Paramecium sonneborni]